MIEEGLMKLCRSVIIEFKQAGWSVGDQDVIHRFFPEWKDKSVLHLDEGYNMFADDLTYYIRHLGYSLTSDSSKKTISVVHFIGKFKPWMKLTPRKRFWLLYTWIRNPYYYTAYKLFRSYLSEK